jgi:hypothetical protein
VAIPDEKKIKEAETKLRSIIGLFSGKRVLLIQCRPEPDSENTNRKRLGHRRIMRYDLKNENYWTLLRSSFIQEIKKSNFDIFLDLDPAFKMTNVFICRSLNPPLRIGLTKPNSEPFFNLLFGRENASYEEKLEGLNDFLKTLELS